MKINTENKKIAINRAAEQWVNLVFAQIEYKRQVKRLKNTNKKENKNG